MCQHVAGYNIGIALFASSCASAGGRQAGRNRYLPVQPRTASRAAANALANQAGMSAECSVSFFAGPRTTSILATIPRVALSCRDTGGRKARCRAALAFRGEAGNGPADSAAGAVLPGAGAGHGPASRQPGEGGPDDCCGRNRIALHCPETQRLFGPVRAAVPSGGHGFNARWGSPARGPRRAWLRPPWRSRLPGPGRAGGSAFRRC